MAVAALVLAAIPILISFTSAVSKQQRDLRGRLRSTLRDVSEACRDYQIEQRRGSACRILQEASKQLAVIEDEGIKSPTPRQVKELHLSIYDLATREEAFRNAEPMFRIAMSEEEREQLRPNYQRSTDINLRYVARLAACYRKATRRMDNSIVCGFLTYWRYRLLPPFIVRR